MQPTLTQVPPSPHVVPASDGLTKSQTATFLPYLAAALLADHYRRTAQRVERLTLPAEGAAQGQTAQAPIDLAPLAP